MSGIYSYILSFFWAKKEEVPAKKKSKDGLDSGGTIQSDAQRIPNSTQSPRQSAENINEQSKPKIQINEGKKTITINGPIKNIQVGDHNAMLILPSSHKKSRVHLSSASNYSDENPNGIVIKKATERYLDSYKMSSVPRGHMLIINNHSFNEKLEYRSGSKEDIFKLNLLFKLLLKFDVQIKQQLTAEDIYKEIKSFANSEQHKKTDSCILCVMSHGNKDGVLGTDNRSITIEQILSLFKNKIHLSGKPKLFLFQSCRGSEMNITLQSDSPSASGTDSTYVPPAKIEHKYQSLQLGDFLIGNATIHGYQALRNSNSGSWFITAIFTEFIDHAYNTDMLGLTNIVNRNVTNISKAGKMQQPEWQTSLNKKWYLYPGL